MFVNGEREVLLHSLKSRAHFGEVSGNSNMKLIQSTSGPTLDHRQLSAIAERGVSVGGSTLCGHGGCIGTCKVPKP